MVVPDLKTGSAGRVFETSLRANERGVRMKIPRFLACAAFAAAFSATLPAQQAPSGYHTVNCIKIKPEKSAEFRKWIPEVLQKFAQARVDSGAVTTWYLLRNVMPTGTVATCDYLTVSIYPGAPPEPLSPEQTAAVLKKAGVSMTAEEYMTRRDSMATLVSSSLFQNVESLGSASKGGYLSVAYMKTDNLNDWLEMERKVWKPVAEQMIKDGVESGWSVNIQAFGQDSELPYQGVTVDVYPSWDAVWKDDPQFLDRFKKVHPDTDFYPAYEKIKKIRTQIHEQLYAIDDRISAAK
jgi:hypothetical protein